MVTYHRRRNYGRRNGSYMRRNSRYGRLYSNRNRRTGGYNQQDTKRVDKILTADIIAGTITVDPAPINGMTVGSGEQQRIGKQAVLSSVHVFGVIGSGQEDSSSTFHNSSVYEVMLVLDTQTNGAIFTAADLFETAAAGELGLRHWEFISRFKILKKQNIWCDVATSETSVTAQMMLEQTKKVNLRYKFNPPLKVRYKGTGGAISDIQDMAIILVIRNMGNENVYVTKTSRYNLFTRCIYTG